VSSSSLHTQERQGRWHELRSQDAGRADVCSLGEMPSGHSRVGTTPDQHTLVQVWRSTRKIIRYEDLLGKSNTSGLSQLACCRSTTSGSAVPQATSPYTRRKRPVLCRHKLANSLTRLLGHKRDAERALLEQVKHCYFFSSIP
jgi:hypothetical protein